VETTVFLIRHGVTEWHRERRIVGQREVPLSAEGVAQAKACAAALGHIPVGEIISSPALRAVQTAEIIAAQFSADITRDPRLSDLRYGKWEGMSYAEVEKTPEYQGILANLLTQKLPGGEDLTQARDRSIRAIEQALRDAPAGESLAVVSHASVLRLILSRYLGTNVVDFHRIRLSPCSVSVLQFRDDRELPRVLAVGWRPHLTEVL
jgi:broad specificity phosphatase PhoE